MVVFLLSACANISKGYSAILSEYIQGLIPVFFDSPESLFSHAIMEPDLILVKEEGLNEIPNIIQGLVERFPKAIIAVGHLPDKSLLNGTARHPQVYSFPLSEPEDVTMNQIMAQLVMQEVKFEPNENPKLGEAFDLFKKYLLLNANLAVCLSHIAKGEPASQIGARMHLSPRTIEDYTVRLKQVFGCQTKKELVQIYARISNMANTMAQEKVNTRH